MKNRRFVLVIMDSTGRSVRRISVARKLIQATVAVAALILLTVLGMAVHGMTRYRAAVETNEIRQENTQLAGILRQLAGQMPELRRLEMRSEVGLAQLWSKSGLGIEPRQLAIGPLEASGSSTLPGTEEPLATAIDGRLLSLEPVALPFEFDRLRTDGRNVHHALGELLEYFHDAERILSHTPSVRPTNSPWITSSFGKRRDPVFGVMMMHKGLDIGGQLGQEIRSPSEGVVIFTGIRGGYGQTVVVDHGFGLQTHYAHLSRIMVQVGQKLNRGDLVALMGSTGKSTGPHLHYEVRRLGQPLDPRRFILD